MPRKERKIALRSRPHAATPWPRSGFTGLDGTKECEIVLTDNFILREALASRRIYFYSITYFYLLACLLALRSSILFERSRACVLCVYPRGNVSCFTGFLPNHFIGYVLLNNLLYSYVKVLSE